MKWGFGYSWGAVSRVSSAVPSLVSPLDLIGRRNAAFRDATADYFEMRRENSTDRGEFRFNNSVLNLPAGNYVFSGDVGLHPAEPAGIRVRFEWPAPVGNIDIAAAESFSQTITLGAATSFDFVMPFNDRGARITNFRVDPA